MLLYNLLAGLTCDTKLDLKNVEITGITSDSRKVTPGCLFVCVKGMRSDGHDFAKAAVEAGAAAILCEKELGLPQQVWVRDTLGAFAVVCENWFGNPLAKLRLVGVTGTNGKTSTTYILKNLLEKCGYKVGLIGTICNMIGDEVLPTEYTTPATFELHEIFGKMRDAKCDFCLMEVSSQALDQGRVDGLKFETSCFTNLTQDHLDVHGTMERYFSIKCRIFNMSRSTAINMDDEWCRKIQLPDSVRGIKYGVNNPDAECRASNVEYRADGVSFDVSFKGMSGKASIPIPGEFSVHNALSAFCCALNVGVPFPVALEALSTCRGVKGRAEVYPIDKPYTVIIDYAHAPDGVANILSAMRAVMKKDGRLVIVIGCGGDRDPLKRPIMGETASRLADFVIVTSDNPRTEEPMSIIEQIIPGVKEHDTPYVVIENRREAIEYAVRNAQENDVIVLAGKGHEDYQIIGKTKHHFDEREVLSEIFAKLESEEN